MSYEKPVIADYGDLTTLTAALHHGSSSDASFPCGRWCDTTLS
jgi:hypothetical protein